MSAEQFPKDSFPGQNQNRWEHEQYALERKIAEYNRVYGEKDAAPKIEELKKRFENHTHTIDTARVALDAARAAFDAAFAIGAEKEESEIDSLREALEGAQEKFDAAWEKMNGFRDEALAFN